MSRPLVRIVIPFAYDEVKKGERYEVDLRESLRNQYGLGESFDISIVFVLQEKSGQVHDLKGWDDFESKTLVFKADGFEYPSVFHQVEMGFKHCLDAEYCMYMTANDTLAPLFIFSAIQRMIESEAKVVYGDTLYVTPSGDPRQCDKPAKEFKPFEWFKDRGHKTNQIPDICLIDCSILELVSFDANFKRASFLIWWYRIWERFGHIAFCYVNTIGCLYRPHDGHESENKEWVETGTIVANRWLKSRPWNKWTDFA